MKRRVGMVFTIASTLLLLSACSMPPKGPSNDRPQSRESLENRASRTEEASLPWSEESVFRLEDVVVTARPLGRRDLLLPEASRLVDEETFSRRNVLTTPDALEEEVGVVVQKTELGGGSPVIRGRTGKEILYLIDGQRFNNMTFRNNTQYLNTVDLNALDRIEVIRGPASVIYGSDAMGGALNLVTRTRALVGENDLGGRLVVKYESADQGWTTHLGTEGEYEGIGFTAGFTLKRLDDLRAGRHGNPAGVVDIHGRQDPTGYRERDFSLDLVKRLGEKHTLDFMLLHSRLYDVPRSDRLIANDEQPVPNDLVNEYDPQILRWYALRYRYLDQEEILESVTLTLSLNQPREGRRRIKASNPDEMLLEEDEVTAPGLSARFGLRPHEDHVVSTGFEAYMESIDSKASTMDLNTGTVTPENHGRYPDDATYRSFGTYLQDEWRFAGPFQWTNGVRYSLSRVRLDFQGLEVGPLPPFGRTSETYDDVTFSTCLSYSATKHTRLYGSISRGFRTPNLNDMASLGDFASGNRVPNVDLDPETVLNYEIGTLHRSAPLDAGASAAAAFYDDMFDTNYLFSSGGEDYYQVDNVSKAIVYSLESWMDVTVVPSSSPAPEQVIFGQAFLNWGRNRTDREPLSKIPPAEGLLGYRLEEPTGAWFAEAFFRGALKQGRLSASDEADPRIPEGGTPKWWTFNLRGGFDIHDGVRLTASLENLFDQRYRIHGSGIDAPGLNVVVSLECPF